MSGRARVSGHESFMPSRRLEVARSYVQGLEEVRDRYQRVQADHLRLNHEAITLASHNLILTRVLRAILDEIPEETLTELLGDTYVIVAGEVLDNADSLLDEIYSCPCGHSKFDHDEKGCSFLHCRKVCA